jgi:anti-anti-sigma factor
VRPAGRFRSTPKASGDDDERGSGLKGRARRATGEEGLPTVRAPAALGPPIVERKTDAPRSSGPCAEGHRGIRTHPPMSDQWSLVRTDAGVSVRGEIDLSTAEDFEEQLHAAAMEAGITFEIDLSDVTFIDSTGITAMIHVVDAVPTTDVVVRASRQAFIVLDLVGMAEGAWANVVVLPPPEDDAVPTD